MYPVDTIKTRLQVILEALLGTISGIFQGASCMCLLQ